MNEKKQLAWKSDEARKEYVESIRYKNELKNKLERIVLLEEIINELNNYIDDLFFY
jgi:hypothetical protein